MTDKKYEKDIYTDGEFTNPRIRDKTPDPAKRIIMRDHKIKGLHCKITPKGKRVFFYGYRTLEGVQRKKKLGDFSESDNNITHARQNAEKMRVDINEGGDPSRDKRNITIAPDMRYLKSEWDRLHKPIKRPSSQVSDERNWNKHILSRFGNLKIHAISTMDIQSLKVSMINTPGAANRTLALLNTAFNLAEDWKLRDQNSNPCKGVKHYDENELGIYLEDEQYAVLIAVLEKALIEKSKNISGINAFRLMLYTGCRRGEIFNLQWDYVKLRKPLEKSTLEFPQTKGGKNTIINISPQAAEILASLKKIRPPDNPYVCYGTKKGKPIKDVRGAWEQVIKEAGLDPVFRLHDLRHSFGSKAIREGVTVHALMGLMGHKTITSTMRYVHHNEKTQQKASQTVGVAIFDTLKINELT